VTEASGSAPVGGEPAVGRAGVGGGGRWSRVSRPRLPSKVRLQWDESRGQAMLLFPEGVLMLNPTAHSVLELVDGRRTLGEIVSRLGRTFDAAAPTDPEAESVDLSTDPGTDTGEHEELAHEHGVEPAAAVRETPAERESRIERDVVGFLESLEARGWILREEATSTTSGDSEP
jgi:pyrroloquinoline quinone biosynthesis protein D